ncbi:MAG: chitobiase/beta-hexosaminidase C-terminal domain-containing protein [Saprospiraceae bacterium]|nr:chitobiase/beta-hexosaminidase C-terminal domain-containing protein [Saprospiraceae bacterium]
MKNIHFLIVFLSNVAVLSAQDAFQLAPPLLKYPSVFFTKEAKIDLVFAEPNTQIHYTLNGEEPTENAQRYTHPLSITKNFTTVKARVFGKNYLPSDVVQATFIKEGLPIKSAETTLPNPKYKGSGAKTLIDNEGGKTTVSSPTWLGFQTDTVDVILNLHKKEKFKKVLIGLLRDYGSWIFLPEKIAIYAFDDKKNYFQLLDNQIFNQSKDIKGSFYTPSVLSLKKSIKTDKIKIQLHVVKQIPDWHVGKGNRSWIFIDEIKVYGDE